MVGRHGLVGGLIGSAWPRRRTGRSRALSAPDDDDLAREPRQALDATAPRRRGRRGPRCGRPSRPRGRRRARPRRPSGSAAARRAPGGRAMAPRGWRGRSRGRSRARSASPWPAASMTPRATASIARPLGERPAVVDPRRRPPRAPRWPPPGPARRARRSRGRGPTARRRTASASCRSGSRATCAPKSNSRTAPSRTGRSPGDAVRQRGLRARQAGHVEGERLGAAGPDQPLESERQVRLGDARPDLRQQRRERPVGDRAGRRDPLDLGRLLDGPVGLDPALDRDELDVRAPPRRAGPRSRARRTRPRPRRAARRPTPRAPASAPAGRCTPRRAARRAPRGAPGSCSASRRAPRPRRRRRGTGPSCPADLLLAVAEGEPGQVAHVLAPDAEVGVDPGRREARPQTRPAGRAGRPGRPPSQPASVPLASARAAKSAGSGQPAVT